MDEFNEWPINNEELEEKEEKREAQLRDKKIYNKKTCEARKASEENCRYCYRKCK
jgi:hypothetical protein